MMNLSLPSKYEQKRLIFRPSMADAIHVYDQINVCVFDSELIRPKLHIAPRCRKYWGMCYGEIHKYKTGSHCEIRLMDKWYCTQWFVTIIAHEMVHQHQWDIDGPKREDLGKAAIMSHGPTFFRFKEKLAEYDIPLKTAHSQRRWFKYQNLFNC